MNHYPAEESQRKLEDAERCHSVEVEQLNLRLIDTRDTLSSRVGEVEAELRAAQQLISSKNSALSDRDKEGTRLTGQIAELRQEIMIERQRELDREEEASALLQSILSSKESLVASKDSIIGGLQDQPFKLSAKRLQM